MIPQTFPTAIDTTTGKRVMIAYSLSSISGLVRWTDYIPVKLTTGILPTKEGTTDNDGYIPISFLSSTTGKVSGIDYVPVYIDASATDAWVCSTVGYIPYGIPGGSGSAMSLTFAGATALDSRITFTRASSATRTNASGLIETLATDAPRFDYDPVTLAPKGLLIEEQRTNLLTYSEQFDNAIWSLIDTVISANQTVSPDGSVSSDLATEGSAGSATVTQVASITANATITFSVFLKRGNHDWVRMTFWEAAATTNRVSVWVNLATGTIGTVAAGGTATATGATISAVANGFYRVSLTGAVNNAATSLGFITSSASADNSLTRVNGGTRYIWGAQLEAGSFPTSYIPTTTASATRAADVSVMTGTNFSSWYNQSAGTWVAEYEIPFDASPSLFPIVMGASDGTFNNCSTIFERTVDDTRRSSIRNGGVQQYELVNGSTYSYGSVSKQATAYSANDAALSVGGATVSTASTLVTPYLNQLSIGTPINGSLNWINGHIRRITYYPTRLTNSQLQSLSA